MCGVSSSDRRPRSISADKVVSEYGMGPVL